jgi:hypothetical protein
MAEQLFNQFADLAALEKQKADILAIFVEIKSGIKNLSDIGLKIEGSKGVRDLSTAQQEYNAYIKDTDRLKKQLLDSEKKLYESERKYAEVIAANRVELQKRNAELKASAQYQAAETGSIEKARAAIKQLTQERDKLNLFTEEGRAKQKKLNEEIDKYNNFIKKSVSLLEQQKINVGNYAGSLAKPFESLQNTLNKLKSIDLSKLGGPIGGGRDENREAAGRKLTDDLDKIFVKASREGVNATTQVKLLESAFQKLSLAANPADKEMQKFLNQFKKEVGEAKAAVQDLKAEIKLNASDTKGIDNVVGSLNALAGIAQGAAGAYALFGANEEEATKITAKLIAVQGIANSIQQVGQELTRKGTYANTIYATVQNLVATAMDRTSAASVRLAAAGKLLLASFAVIGLVVLVAELFKVSKASDAAAKSLEDLNEVRKEGLKNAETEISKLKLLYEATQNQSLSLNLRKKAVDELQKQYPAYFKNLSDEAILAGKASDAYQKLTEKIIQNGLAEAAKEKIKQISGEILDSILQVNDAEKLIANTIKNGVLIQKDVNIKRLASGNVVNDSDFSFSKNQKDIDKAVNGIKNQYSAAYKAVADGNARINSLISGIGAANILGGVFSDSKKGADNFSDSKKGADNKKELKKQIDVEFELYKLRQQRIIDGNRIIVDNEEASYQDRLIALTDFTKRTIELSNAQLEKDKEGKSRDEIKILEEKAYNDRIKIYQEYQAKLAVLQKDGNKKEVAEFKVLYNKFHQKLKKAVNKGLQTRADGDAKKKEAEDKINAEIKNKRKELYKELQQLLISFIADSFTREEQALDEKERLLNKEKERRINSINLSGLPEVERTKKIAEAEKQAAFELEQIEKRKRKLAYDRAKFEKAANVASIISTTAQAVVGALKPDGFTPLPLRIQLAALIGSIGSLQLFRALTAPLPQYEKGTNYAAKGPAIVGEKGHELGITKQGQVFITPAQPTLVELAGGEKIFNADITKDIINSFSLKHLINAARYNDKPQDISNQMAASMIKELKELNSKSRITIINQAPIESSAFFHQHFKS